MPKKKDKTESGERFVGEYEIVGHEEITEKDKKLLEKLLGKKPEK